MLHTRGTSTRYDVVESKDTATLRNGSPPNTLSSFVGNIILGNNSSSYIVSVQKNRLQDPKDSRPLSKAKECNFMENTPYFDNESMSQTRVNCQTMVDCEAVKACALYSICSASMILTNKSLASSYNHQTSIDLNVLLVLTQAIFAVVFIEIAKQMKWLECPHLTVKIIKQWAPVNIFFCAMLFTGMASLQHNSVPMVAIVKNVTNVVIATGDYVFFGVTVEMLVLVSFLVTLGGTVAAAWKDVSSTWVGLFWMITNCVVSAGYVLCMKFATKNISTSKFGMVYVNNLLCISLLMPVAFLKGEVLAFASAHSLHTVEYFGKVCMASFTGFLLNFASLNCVSAAGPTTYAVIGSLNKVPVVLLGCVMYDSFITPETWSFICVSLCGGFLYSYAKMQNASKKGNAN